MSCLATGWTPGLRHGQFQLGCRVDQANAIQGKILEGAEIVGGSILTSFFAYAK